MGTLGTVDGARENLHGMMLISIFNRPLDIPVLLVGSKVLMHFFTRPGRVKKNKLFFFL
jgi:hypothetical protein